METASKGQANLVEEILKKKRRGKPLVTAVELDPQGYTAFGRVARETPASLGLFTKISSSFYTVSHCVYAIWIRQRKYFLFWRPYLTITQRGIKTCTPKSMGNWWEFIIFCPYEIIFSLVIQIKI